MMWDRDSCIAFVVVGLTSLELDAGYSLRRKGRDADDVRVSEEHQRIDDNGGGPAPCTDFVRPEPISPSGNCAGTMCGPRALRQVSRADQ
jgi:hypothetical protein